LRTIVAPDFAALLQALAGEIERLRRSDPLRRVSVVTPGDLGRETVRRALAADRGTIGIAVRSLQEWIGELAADEIARRGGRSLSEPAFERLVAKVVERRVRGARGEGVWSAAADTPGLTRMAAASIGDLSRARLAPEVIATSFPLDAIRLELLRTFAEVVADAEARNLWDRRAEEALAADVAAESPDETPLLFFGFHDLTSLQRHVVDRSASRHPLTLLVPGPGGPGDAATASLVDWARTRGEFEAVDDAAARSVEPEFATYPTEAAEVRAVLRRIRREVEERDRSFDDFLVVVPRSGPSPALIRRLFAKAGIPLADRAGVPATRTEEGRRALTLARAAGAPRDDRLREALAFLRVARGEDGAPPDPGAFEAFLRARDWNEIVHAYRALHESVLGGAVPADVAVALDAIALVHGNAPARPREFAGALAGTMSSIVNRAAVASEDGDASVLLVRIDNARGLSRPFVFFPGWIDGALHRAPAEDPLLPDWLRETWNVAFEHTGRTLPLRFAAREERTLLLRFALETAAETAVVSWARRARTGSESRNPSGVLVDAVSRRAGRPVSAGDPEFLEHAPAPDPREIAGDAVDRTDLELAVLSGAAAFPGPAASADAKRVAPLFANGFARDLRAVLRATEDRWRPDRLTRHDGALAERRAIELVWNRVRPDVRPWSPTRLAAAANCPFGFLVENVLGLDPARETGDDYDPLERGEIFHALVEEVYHGLHAAGALPLDPEKLPGALRLLGDVASKLSLGTRAPASRAHRAATLAALRNDAAIVLARDACRPDSERTTPVHFELEFGFGDSPAPRVDLGGTSVPLRGKADRVDLAPDGSFDVLDYKTGRVSAKSHRLATRDDGKVIVHLQAPLYLLALRELLARPPRRATLYYATAEHGFEEVVFDAEDLDRARPWLGKLIRAVLDDVERGWFPCTPGKTCCRPELRLACGSSVAARFRRKSSDPELAARVVLVRGEGDADSDLHEEADA